MRDRLVTRPLAAEWNTEFFQQPCELTDEVRAEIRELDEASARLVWNHPFQHAFEPLANGLHDFASKSWFLNDDAIKLTEFGVIRRSKKRWNPREIGVLSLHVERDGWYGTS